MAADRLEAQIGQWRAYLQRRRAIHAPDVAELEDHLRNQIATLVEAGLADDEAFLVAVKRMGSLDAVSREFAREHSERLWKQLVVSDGDRRAGTGTPLEPFLVFGAAGLAALTVKAPALFGYDLSAGTAATEAFYLRNASLFVLPWLTAYFVWKRQLDSASIAVVFASFAAAALLVNVYPFAVPGSTIALAALHLPIALWLSVGLAYAGGRWRSHAARMDFVRFSGELFIYFVLIALGGGVLTGFTGLMFMAIGLDIEWFMEAWLVPCGAAGAVIVAAWLVEAKQSVIENMAPVLTRLFTPLFAAALLAFLATMAWTGSGIDVERDVLIGFDLALVLVLGLLLYSISARDVEAPPTLFDGVQLLLVVTALVVDVIALAAIAARISEFGFSPNKVAALGENIILLVNLGWSAWLYAQFLRRRAPFAALERWQMAYLPVYSLWAAFVVAAFPPLFGYA